MPGVSGYVGLFPSSFLMKVTSVWQMPQNLMSKHTSLSPRARGVAIVKAWHHS